jgi:cell division transport system permease protein
MDGLSVMKWIKQLIHQHAHAMLSTLGNALRRPLAISLTVLVLAITLTLPSLLFLGVNHLKVLSNKWSGSASITIFMQANVDQASALQLAQQLEKENNLNEINFLHKDKALEEFTAETGFPNISQSIGENPLPHILLVQLDKNISHNELSKLIKTIEKHNEINQILWDQQWIQRLHSILEIANQVVLIISVLLSSAVLLVLGNTIRLEIQNKHQEIKVLKLIGATNTYIKRPFLYYGAWLGMIGGLFSMLITLACTIILSPAIENLAKQYQLDFQLIFFSFSELAALIAVSTLLGWLGALIAVSRHIQKIESNGTSS